MTDKAKKKHDGKSSATKRWIFVRNLAYSVDDAKLQSWASDIGPIKNCFVVKDKGKQHCRFIRVEYSQFILLTHV